MLTEQQRLEQLGVSDELANLMARRYTAKTMPIISDQIYTLMALDIQALPVEKKYEYMDRFDKDYAIVKELVHQIATISPAHKRMEVIHQLIDTEKGIKEAAKEASCRKGCSACCHLHVDITNDEARVLRRLLPQDKETRQRLKKQAGIKDRYNFQYLLPRADSACVFLKDHQCSIYESRPMVCRTFYVKSPPELCDWELHPDVPTQQFIERKVELLKTLAFQMFGCETMARQLLK